MEYLSRSLKGLHSHRDFRFHPKCGALGITHLSFADDLLLFSKGTVKSVTALLSMFETFCQTSGLHANMIKSEIYYAGVSNSKRAEIGAISHLKEGQLPFRYLGVPLSSKRLSVAQYQPLMDKLLGKVRHWSAKLLSYGVHMKADKLWIKWIHTYYIGDQSVMHMEVPSQASVMFKKLLKIRDKVKHLVEWQTQLLDTEFRKKDMYKILRIPTGRVAWSELIMQNLATPRARFVMWMALWGRLATRERLKLFNVSVQDDSCIFCGYSIETVSHVLFECVAIRHLWSSVYRWLERSHNSRSWEQFIIQICRDTKGKKMQNRFLKALAAELVYAIWQERNRRIFTQVQTDLQVILRLSVQNVMGRGSQFKEFVLYCRKFTTYPVL